LFFGQELGNISSYAPSENITSSVIVKGDARNGSPPWRNDDKDGHYMFAVGDNLTSRCNYTSP
jgi:dual-specificity kinase